MCGPTAAPPARPMCSPTRRRRLGRPPHWRAASAPGWSAGRCRRRRSGATCTMPGASSAPRGWCRSRSRRLDMALWDALAVRAGLPLCALLGGEPKPVPIYASLRGWGAAMLAEEAGRAVATLGARWVKFKIGQRAAGGRPGDGARGARRGGRRRRHPGRLQPGAVPARGRAARPRAGGARHAVAGGTAAGAGRCGARGTVAAR